MKTSVVIRWEDVFNEIKTEFKGFDKALKKQFGKKRFGKSKKAEVTLEECISRVNSKNPEDMVSLDGSVLEPCVICVDIDSPKISKRILALYENEDDLFHKIFEQPFIVETSQDHLHLWYKIPHVENFLVPKTPNKLAFQHFSKTAASRLGFQAEYKFTVTTFSGPTRKILSSINFSQISQIPPSLYPYNYVSNSENVGIIKIGDSQLIPEGSRNNLLFYFLNKDNFNFYHTKVTSYLCFECPLDDNELTTLTDIKARNQYKNPADFDENNNKKYPEGYVNNNHHGFDCSPYASAAFFNFSFTKKNEGTPLRLRAHEDISKVRYEDLVTDGIIRKGMAKILERLGFNPQRAEKALMDSKTNPHVINYVALMESKFDFFLDDDLWMGESLMGAVTILLLEIKFLHAVFIDDEKTYYIYNNQYWVPIEENEISATIAEISTNVQKFENVGVNSSSEKSFIMRAIKQLKTFDTWPSIQPGFNFINGSLIKTEENSVELVDHKPEHYFRKLIKINFDFDQYLLPLESRFLLDMTEGDINMLNVIRLALYCCLESTGNQVGFFLTGEPGGCKSSFTALLEGLITECKTSPKVNLLHEKFQGIVVKDANIFFIHDIGEDSIGDETATFMKQVVSGDKVTLDIKFQKAITITPHCVVFITTNYEPQQFRAFKESAFSDRLIIIKVPSIKAGHRIANFIQVLKKETKNFAGIVNWALNIPEDIVSRINRASSLNNIVAPEVNMVDNFALDQLVYQPKIFISYEELKDSYNKYITNETQVDDESRSKKNMLLSKSKVAQLFKSFSTKCTLETTPIPHRTSKHRGFLNVNFKPSNGVLSANQKNFVFFQDNALANTMASDPFYFNGVLIKNSVELIQTTNISERAQIGTNLCISSVVNRSSKMLLQNQVDPNYLPNEHLNTRLKKTGPKIYDLNYKDNYPILDNVKNITKNEPLSADFIKKEIEQHLNQQKLPYLNITRQPITNGNDNINNQLPNNISNLEPVSNQNLLKSNIGSNDEFNNNTVRVQNKKITEPEQILINENKDPWILFDKLLGEKVKSRINSQYINHYGLLGFESNIKFHFEENRKDLSYIYKELQKNLITNPIEPYNDYNVPYKSIKQIKKSLETFVTYPFFGPITLFYQINEIFIKSIEQASNILKNNKIDDKYLKRSIPGMKTTIDQSSLNNLKFLIDQLQNQKTTTKALETLENEAQYLLLFGTHETTDDAHDSTEKMWNGRSLFPNFYLKGTDSYGRLKTVPSTTLSSVKKEVKTIVLNQIKNFTKLRFFELDLKGCHTTIFYALSNLPENEKYQFPSINELWEVLIKELKFHVYEIDKDKSIDKSLSIDLIKGWNNSQLKKLLKTQWYKALNGGSLFNVKENLENNKNYYGLNSDNINNVEKVLNQVFKKLKFFKNLENFQYQVSKNQEIYLPTQNKPFKTSTLSKKQKSSLSTEQTYEKSIIKGRSTMSRIFSTCELVLIMLVFVSLEKFDNLMPIAYEADGLLLAGYFDNPDELLEQINDSFKSYASKFINQEVSLELKNLI